MITYEDLKEEAFGRYCRSCINERFSLELEKSDCLYDQNMRVCARCKEKKNIVVSIKHASKMKLLRGKDWGEVDGEIPGPAEGSSVREILTAVAEALREKGYDPAVQIAGYLISEDPTYITSNRGARTMVRQLDRNEVLEELVKHYMQGGMEADIRGTEETRYLFQPPEEKKE